MKYSENVTLNEQVPAPPLNEPCALALIMNTFISQGNYEDAMGSHMQNAWNVAWHTITP